jgi:DNA-binding MarR family transcriptional regulator
MSKKNVDEVRSFNRFFVRTIGVLDNTILNSGYSLTEAHILNLVNSNIDSTATTINKELNLDEGYLSRVIKKLVSKGLITKKQSEFDKRVFVVNSTNKGKIEYQKLDNLSSDMVKSNIKHLNQNEQLELIDLLKRVEILMRKE